MYVQHCKVNYATPTGSFRLLSKDKELGKSRNMIEILPEMLEREKFCVKPQNVV
jgi:hypothetical protein